MQLFERHHQAMVTVCRTIKHLWWQNAGHVTCYGDLAEDTSKAMVIKFWTLCPINVTIAHRCLKMGNHIILECIMVCLNFHTTAQEQTTPLFNRGVKAYIIQGYIMLLLWNTIKKLLILIPCAMVTKIDSTPCWQNKIWMNEPWKLLQQLPSCFSWRPSWMGKGNLQKIIAVKLPAGKILL